MPPSFCVVGGGARRDRRGCVRGRRRRWRTWAVSSRRSTAGLSVAGRRVGAVVVGRRCGRVAPKPSAGTLAVPTVWRAGGGGAVAWVGRRLAGCESISCVGRWPVVNRMPRHRFDRRCVSYRLLRLLLSARGAESRSSRPQPSCARARLLRIGARSSISPAVNDGSRRASVAPRRRSEVSARGRR